MLTMKTLGFSLVCALFALILSSLSLGQKPEAKQQSPISKTIPKTWDDKAINSLQLPLPDPRVSTKFISSSYYYSIPVRPVYKSYEVYRPDREPRGYMDQLKRKAPQVIFDPSKLESEADWTKAG